MKENEINVLEQYDIDINSTRKVRGAILCETNQGFYLLKEFSSSKKRIPMLYQLSLYLQEQGYGKTDMIVKNREGEFVSEAENGTEYILKRWFDGKECDVKKETDIIAATENLAHLHAKMSGEQVWGNLTEKTVPEGEDLCDTYRRHNRELKKVRMFIRAKVGKGEFELTYLKHFEEMYDWAAYAADMIEKSNYEVLLERSRSEHTITHGDYNYHNVLMMSDEIATTNFEHFRNDVQVSDLYYFLRKTMEKNKWSSVLGDKMLNAYSRIRPLEDNEMKYLTVCIIYPEKFWKSADAYYRSGKAWIPTKTVEKLHTSIAQVEEKKQFLNTIFSFHL